MPASTLTPGINRHTFGVHRHVLYLQLERKLLVGRKNIVTSLSLSQSLSLHILLTSMYLATEKSWLGKQAKAESQQKRIGNSNPTLTSSATVGLISLSYRFLI